MLAHCFTVVSFQVRVRALLRAFTVPYPFLDTFCSKMDRRIQIRRIMQLYIFAQKPGKQILAGRNCCSGGMRRSSVALKRKNIYTKVLCCPRLQFFARNSLLVAGGIDFYIPLDENQRCLTSSADVSPGHHRARVFSWQIFNSRRWICRLWSGGNGKNLLIF